jgi:hypothetical protein
VAWVSGASISAVGISVLSVEGVSVSSEVDLRRGICLLLTAC